MAACPDPSAHKHTSKLSEQASTAALYVTHPERNTDPRAAEKTNPLGPDGKLSSKSAAASLKYAKAQDLPSFPTAGIAANSASKAALLAKDYKMKELWQPEQSSAGSKAAILAARDGGKLQFWQPEATEAGNSAATLAMQAKGLSPQLDYGYTEEGKSRALLAATLSVSQGKQRANTMPAPVDPAYPDSKNSAANALNAASVSHRNSTKMAPDGWSSEANQAARIKNSHMDPAMFGERPPVELEMEEQRHQAALRASAVSVAKQMYEYQNRTVLGSDTTGKEGAEAASSRQGPSAQLDVKQEALRYIHLQDAARKLANERLAKVDKNFEAARYREYYGYGDDKSESKPAKKGFHPNRMSMHSRPREDADFSDSDDEGNARRIRGQMSQLNKGLSEVDDKKRNEDRAKLMAAAEKRVQSRMHDMDEKVFSSTGKVPPALMEEWEAKARKRAQEEKEQQDAHPGMTHIGGGKFIDQAEIEAIAAARLKPTLDSINENAEKRRARDAELAAEKEENEKNRMEEKMKQRNEKDEAKRVKNEEKAAWRKFKDEDRARKNEEKRVAQEEKRKVQEEERKVQEEKRKAQEEKRRAEEEKRAETRRAEEEKRRAEEEERKANEPETEAVVVPAAVGAGAVGAGAATEDAEKKRGSTLGRFASRLKRRSQMPESGEAATERPVTAERISTPVIVTDEASAIEAPVVGEKAESLATPVGEETDNLAPLTVVSSGHTGSHTDALPSPEQEKKAFMPNLERHISTIETSSDESGGEDEVDSDADDEAEGRGNSKAVAGGGFVGAVATGTAVMSDDTDRVTDGKVDVPALSDIPATDATGHGDAMHTVGPHDTDLGNILDPHVKPDAEELKEKVPEVDPVSPDNGNVLKKVPSGLQLNPVSAEEKEESKKAQKAAAAIVPVTDTSSSTDKGKLHKKSSSAVGNTTTVSSAQDNGATPEKKGVRGFFSKLKNRSSRSGSKPDSPSTETKALAGTAVAGTAAAGTTTAVIAADEPTTPLAEHMGTDGPIGDDAHVSGLDGNPGPESPSSFKRGDFRDRDGDYDDVSSSGMEEEDVERGRTGRQRRKSKPVSGKALTRKTTDDSEGAVSPMVAESNDDETFEEARDHFDESLAPPPAFGGQAKTVSPSRETKFQEEL